MFETPCPECKKKLTLKHRINLLFHSFTYCYFCNKQIKIKFVPQILNSAAIGVLFGGSLALITELSLNKVILITAIVVIVFQRFIDIFFSLTSSKDNDLF